VTGIVVERFPASAAQLTLSGPERSRRAPPLRNAAFTANSSILGLAATLQIRGRSSQLFEGGNRYAETYTFVAVTAPAYC